MSTAREVLKQADALRAELDEVWDFGNFLENFKTPQGWRISFGRNGYDVPNTLAVDFRDALSAMAAEKADMLRGQIDALEARVQVVES